jgi:hypothetical protein
MWKSVILWPEEVSTGNDPNISTDDHETAEMAISVCEAIKREGLGGEGKIFPLDTYVLPVFGEQKK